MSNTFRKQQTASMWYSLDASSPAPAVDEIGGKGRSLIQCHQVSDWDVLVPEGFVLTVSFFELWLHQIQASVEYHTAFDQVTDDRTRDESSSTTTTSMPTYFLSRADCDAVKKQCDALMLSKEQQAALDAAGKACFVTNNGNWKSKPPLCAVRSSAPQEDSSHASLAGLYHTTLGVRLDQPDELLQALRDSFASVFDFRVTSIYNAAGAPYDFRLAVVVQRQLDSQVSGVAFSLDPQSNCYDEAVISANHGLGETVVAGIVTPDTYKVDKVKQAIISKEISEKKIVAYVLNKEDESGKNTKEMKVENPALPALRDVQILEVASLVDKVERFLGIPIDIEWAFEEERLFLLQARPITTYIQLFPEMITPPGEPKRLYMDVTVGTQGFSEPMSVLGLEIWGRMLRVAKPHLQPGPDGTIWELHGRQYLIASNMLAVPYGEKMVRKLFETQGGRIRRILAFIDFNEYRPAKPTDKNKYFMLMMARHLLVQVPSMMKGMCNLDKAMDSYLEKWQDIYERYRPGGKEEQREDISFAQAVDQCMTEFQELIPRFSGMLWAWYSRWRLHKMYDGDREAQDMIGALDMDLNGNPTSEMGHAMLRLASFAEVRDTPSSDAFIQKLRENLFSDEFLRSYNDFMAKFGCRGMKEIDVATRRTYEDPADLFDRIKQIDIENNQILTVKKRKMEAYTSLLEKAAERKCEESFRYHANIIQKLGGYREHPKYVFVYFVAYLRRRISKLANKFVEEGRLTLRQSIFDLHVEEITQAETSLEFSLSDCAGRNKAPYEKVAHINDWPQVIDSRGKIFRGPRDDVQDGIGGDPISPGTAIGRARVLSSPYEAPLVRGEILVTKATEPSWTPIFLNASGVVLEVGGPLQHGAIIAREYGIPCVSGVEKATKVICDGQLIQVDGTNGIVRIVIDADYEEKKERTFDETD